MDEELVHQIPLLLSSLGQIVPIGFFFFFLWIASASSIFSAIWFISCDSAFSILTT